MNIGFGRTVITPPVGSSLYGYFQDRRSTGIRDNLEANAMILQQGKTVVAMVACDLISVTDETKNLVLEFARNQLSVPVTHLLLHATHTHTGPLTRVPEKSIYERGFYVSPAYLKLLPALIAGSIKIAWETREDMLVGFGQTQAKGIAFNRRYLVDDGRVVTNPRTSYQKIIKSAGPVDETLSIVKITTAAGKVKGLVLNFACHPDTIGGTLISADWPGLVRRKLESQFPGIFTIVFNGPSGDINHINPFDNQTRSAAISERISTVIQEATSSVLDKIETKPLLELHVETKKISLPYRKITPEEVKQARETLKKNIPADCLQKLIATQTVNLAKERAKKKSIPVECVVVGLDQKAGLVGLPGEVFTQIGLDIKSTSPFPYTLVIQNSNTALGYVPSVVAFQQHRQNQKIKPEYDTTRLAEALGINCSYETTTLACRVDEQAGEKLKETSLQLLKKFFHT